MNNVINPRGFHTHGKEFFYAAEAVYLLPKPALLPLAFLWGRSIELLLKSYLLSAGITIKKLRSKEYGHNLVALHKEAITQNIDSLIGKDIITPGIIQLLNFEYGTKRLEYRESGTTYHIPDAEITRQIIRRLIRGIDYHLKQNEKNN